MLQRDETVFVFHNRLEKCLQKKKARTTGETITIKPKTTRITNNQKDKLWQFFDEVDWKYQEPFPKKNGNEQLDQILETLGLVDRKKASRQLARWKQAKYKHAGKTLVFDFRMARKCVMSHMEGKDYKEFVKEVIQRMLGKKVEKENDHYKTVRMYMQLKPKIGAELLEFVLKQDTLVKFFVDVVHFNEELLARVLPHHFNKKVEASLQFSKARREVGTESNNLPSPLFQ